MLKIKIKPPSSAALFVQQLTFNHFVKKNAYINVMWLNKTYIAEFAGTFLLVLIGAGSAAYHEFNSEAIGLLGIALSFGLIVAAMILLLGPISGAHINPAVTIAFRFCGQISSKDMLSYIFSQCCGALAAAGLLFLFFEQPNNLGASLPGPSISQAQAFLLEIFLSFVLVAVILNVSALKPGLLFIALTVGGTVGLEAFFAGPITGASMNPARSLGPAVWAAQWDTLWLYLLAPCIGARLAVTGCRLTQNKNCCQPQ